MPGSLFSFCVSDSALQRLLQLFFTPDCDAELLGLGQLEPAASPPPAHRSWPTPSPPPWPQRLQRRPGIVARQGSEGAGQHEGLAGKGLLRGLFLLDGWPVDAGGQQGPPAPRCCEAGAGSSKRAWPLCPHVGHFQQLLHRGGAQGIQGEEVVGEVQGGRLPTSRIPNANRKRGSVVLRAASMAATRLRADFCPIRSSPAS